ncbi:GIY-YIG nuclease family protein [Agrobacterium tumefaciens]|uniref:GIY-YIG nuclease family protein n=1 Tax=Agrobacterium tumefaciens TaxID=358 RepID=UPI00165984C3|nr:GIY-YIG nuclease family protein [Agrobacterium tumefaciens]QNP81005.1 GIY-YIG nuclease family protein [Agrobacterium tumefaciens]
MTVYFMQQETGDGLVKIGYSDDVARRRVTIQGAAAVPVRIVATLDGGKETEALIHQQLSGSRHFGEWFKPTDEVLSLIESVKSFSATVKPVVKDKDGSFVNERAIEDLRIACELLVAALGPVMPGESRFTKMENELLPKLRAINPAWTSRKLRGIHSKETTNIQLWVVRDLLAVIKGDGDVGA